jgi:hypothetical protein
MNVPKNTSASMRTCAIVEAGANPLKGKYIFDGIDHFHPSTGSHDDLFLTSLSLQMVIEIHCRLHWIACPNVANILEQETVACNL